MNKRLLVMAGGTGGHVFPGLAVAQILADKNWQIHWLGTSERMEAQLVPNAGFPISFIDVVGVRKNGLLRLIAAPLKIIKSIVQAAKVIKQFNPDVVIGMGGFASGPGGIAAWLANKPLVVHEQNAAPGLTNRVLAKVATKVLTGFAMTFTAQKSSTKYIGGGWQFGGTNFKSNSASCAG
jgi:UDP-N-acetylglucosamine--N-acetylmuramyl-(pentapeptide) pyrophosphoryl-undecaprenol N-acetylglucosamine transferase